MFTIDGLRFDWPCDITRTARIRPSELSGIMLDKRWFNDVLGTYMTYSVSVAVPMGAGEDYERLYDALTLPVEGHRFTLPYDRGEITVEGRVEQVSDVYVRLPGGDLHWRGVRFDVVANHPSREMALEQVLERGRSPMPNIAAPAEGDSFSFVEGRWTRVDYADADEIRY